jgi:hypothetical protein
VHARTLRGYSCLAVSDVRRQRLLHGPVGLLCMWQVRLVGMGQQVMRCTPIIITVITIVLWLPAAGCVAAALPQPHC